MSLEPALEGTFAAWMIAGSRVSGLLVVSPFFGSAAMPPRIKVGLALLLSWFMVPFIPARLGPLHSGALAIVLSGEFCIGFILGFTLSLIFEAARIAGQACGVQMGYSLASVINPDSQADSAVLSTFYELIVLLVFLQLDVPHWVLRGLARSLVYLPPGQLCISWPAVNGLLRFASGMFVAGIQISAPILVASLFADVALGFIGKASPQLPVLLVGVSLKNLLGLMLLGGSVAFWPRFFDIHFGRAVDASERILKLAQR